MRKFTKLLFLSVIILSLGWINHATAQCSHSVELVDSYGDGWNGGSLDVYVNGTLVLDDITLSDGAGPLAYTFNADTGDDIDVYYTAGSWSTENEYTVYDGDGNVLGQSGQGGSTPTDIENMVGYCPSCIPPSDQTETNVTTTSADLGWTENGSATTWEIEWGPAGFSQGSGTTVSTTSNPYSLTGLSDGTSYDWYVRADCGGGSYSSWVGPSTFTTFCNSVTSYPYTETFDGLSNSSPAYSCTADGSVSLAAVCFQNVTGDDLDWDIYSGSTGSSNTGPSDDVTGGGEYLYTESSSCYNSIGSVLSPVFDFSSLSNPAISFYYHMYGSDMGSLELFYTIDGGTTWNSIWSLSGDQGNSWTQATNVLTSLAGESAVIFRWTGTTGSGYASDMAIDEVNVYEAPTDAMDWCNLQWPDAATIDASQDVTVYSQGYEPGVTNADPNAPGAGIDVWIGYSTTDTDPATWSNWVLATYNVDNGNNDEFMADLGVSQGLTAGTYYYASRWQLNGGPFEYGGYNSGGGGFWDGTNNVNGVLTVNPVDGDDCTNPIAISEVIDLPFDNTYATQSGDNPGCGGSNDPYDLWYEYTATYSGDVTVDLCGSGFDTRIALWDACGGTALQCNDDFCGLQSAVSFSVTAGNTYLIQVGGYSSYQGTGDITIAYSNTEWTGTAKSNDWNDASNWTYGVPGPYTDVTIPAGLSNYPTLSSTGYCNNLYIQSTASGDASLLDGGFLNINGTVSVERYLSADQYHSFSPSVDGEVAGIFHLPGSTGLDVYLYSNNEATYDYTEIVDVNTDLNEYEGYMVWVDGANATPPVSGWTFTESGDLNTGAFGSTDNVTMSDPGGTQRGWNFFGNPYTSALDWDAASGWTKTNIDATIYVYNGTQWATYSAGSGGTNGGSQYIAMGQGFFVHKTDAGGPYPETGTLTMDNNVRVHNGVSYLKETIANKVSLQVEGNGYKDETAILFRDDATVNFDSQYDAYKLETEQPGAPTFYSVANTNLAVNVLPQADWVQLGFKSTANGTYTISALEINDIGNVVLEDTFTGEMTDLNVSSYTFNYAVEDDANRFIVHFTPLGVGDNAESMFNIYSFEKNAVVAVPANTEGNIFVYNMMGQNIATSTINSTINKIHIEESGYYVVKVVSDNVVSTKKVFIK